MSANNPDAIPKTLAPVDWHEFPQVSTLVYLLYEVTMWLTFENVCPRVPLGRYAVSIQWNDGYAEA